MTSLSTSRHQLRDFPYENGDCASSPAPLYDLELDQLLGDLIEQLHVTRGVRRALGCKVKTKHVMGWHE